MSNPETSRSGKLILRSVLWLMLVVTMAGNVATSLVVTNVAVHLTFGIGTLLCAAGLAVSHLRGRR
jgi:hypothetical protein